MADRIDFRTYSGLAEDLPTGFDVVFAKSTLVLMGDIAAVGRRLAATLERGGRLIAVENARGPLAMHMLRAAVRRSWRPYGANYFTREPVRAMTQGWTPSSSGGRRSRRRLSSERAVLLHQGEIGEPDGEAFRRRRPEPAREFD